MKTTRRDLRILLLHEFRLGRRTTQAVDNICQSMGKDVLSHRTAQRWFKQFRSKDYEIEDAPRSGRPSHIDLDELKSIVEADPRQTTTLSGTAF